MPLREKLARNINKLLGVKAAPVSQGMQRPVPKGMELQHRESQRHDRRTVMTDCVKMEKTDVRIKRIIGKHSSDATLNGVQIRVASTGDGTEAQQAQDRIDRLVKRTKLERKLKGWAANALIKGDTFIEIVPSPDGKEIAALKMLASEITFSNMDSHGNFPPDRPAYYQEHVYTREIEVEFYPWQIVQIAWDRPDGAPYGRPLFASARTAFNRLESAEQNIVIRRSTNAGRSRHHQVGSDENPGNPEDVEAYKEMNRDALDNPMSAAQDFFSDGRVKITNLEGDTTLGELEDVEYFEGQLAMLGAVPMALLGGGRERSVNRDVLKEQEEDYHRMLVDIDSVLEEGLETIIGIQLLLAGINPDSVNITYHWGAKDRKDLDKKMERAAKGQKMRLSFETAVGMLETQDIEYEQERERIVQQIEEGVIPYALNAKLDPQVAALLSVLQNSDDSELSESLGALREMAQQILDEEPRQVVGL